MLFLFVGPAEYQYLLCADHGALVGDVAPVQPPHDLRRGDAHGRAVDHEGEGVVDRDGGRRRHDDHGWR